MDLILLLLSSKAYDLQQIGDELPLWMFFVTLSGEWLGPKRLLRFDTTPKGAKRDAWQRPCYGRYASGIPNPKVGSGDEPKPNPSLVCHPSIPRHPLNFKVG
jgi:hypothetical protein